MRALPRGLCQRALIPWGGAPPHDLITALQHHLGVKISSDKHERDIQAITIKISFLGISVCLLQNKKTSWTEGHWRNRKSTSQLKRGKQAAVSWHVLTQAGPGLLSLGYSSSLALTQQTKMSPSGSCRCGQGQAGADPVLGSLM